jgi:hypothetical protein
MNTGYQAILEKEDKALILLPKCASQYVRTIKNIRKTWKIHQPSDKYHALELKDKGKEIAVLIRHPLDRIVSAYSYFNTHKTGQNYVLRNKLNFVKEPFPAYVYHLCTTADDQLDKHFRSQYSHVTFANNLIPNIIIKWDFSSLQSFLELDCIPNNKYNKSDRREDWEWYYTDTLQQAAYDRYYADIILWESPDGDMA